MNTKVLLIVAVILLLTAFMIDKSSQKKIEINPYIGKTLFENSRADGSNLISINSQEGKITLKKDSEENWFVEEFNYPVSKEKFNSMMFGLMETKTVDIASDDLASYKTLGVTDYTDPFTGESIFVQFTKSDSNQKNRLILGKGRESKKSNPMPYGPQYDGQFVRFEGEKNVFLADKMNYIEKKPSSWIDTILFNIDAKELKKYEISSSANEFLNYTLNRETKEAELTLLNINNDEKMVSQKVNELIGSFATVQFFEVIKEDQQEKINETLKKEVNSILLKNFSKLEYELQISTKPLTTETISQPSYFIKTTAKYEGNDSTLKSKADFYNKINKDKIFALRKHIGEKMTIPKGALTEKKPAPKLPEAQGNENTTGISGEVKPLKISASHILVTHKEVKSTSELTKEEAKKKIDGILEELKKDPSKFETFAQEVSECPSGKKGGDLGEFPFEKMVKPFSEKAFSLKVNEISDAVETQFGYHIIKRTK